MAMGYADSISITFNYDWLTQLAVKGLLGRWSSKMIQMTQVQKQVWN